MHENSVMKLTKSCLKEGSDRIKRGMDLTKIHHMHVMEISQWNPWVYYTNKNVFLKGQAENYTFCRGLR
jgi:hypothetical protein